MSLAYHCGECDTPCIITTEPDGDLTLSCPEHGHLVTGRLPPPKPVQITPGRLHNRTDVPWRLPDAA